MLTVMNPLLLCVFIELLSLQMSSSSRLGTLIIFLVAVIALYTRGFQNFEVRLCVYFWRAGLSF